MSNLTVWKFEAAGAADEALQKLLQLQKQGLVVVHDGAVVTWEANAKRPRTRQLHNLGTAGAINGAFWGMLFGLIFFAPLLGIAVGAVAGGLSGSLRDFGINDDFIKEVREQVTPGRSALFLLTSGAVPDRLADAFGGVDKELVHTNLSAEEEAQLREVFGLESVPA